MKIKPWWILCAAGLALFAGLGRRALWEDEAETALLARRVMTAGLPYAADKPEISQLHHAELGWDGLWVWTPWAQIYAAALSMALFGAGAWGARTLFAAIGLAGLFALQRMARLFFRKDEELPRLALFFAATCVPLILHFRQCRWFALAFLELVLWWWGYWKTIDGEKGAPAMLIFGMVAFFYTQQLAFAAAALSFLLCHLIFFPRRTGAFIRPALVSAALCAPWLFLQRSFTAPGFPGGPWDRLLFYASELNAHHLPALLAVPWLAARDWRDRRLTFALLFIAAYFLFLSAGPYPYFYRYLIPVMPLIALVQAALSRDVMSRLKNRIAGAAFLAIFAGTNLFHLAAPALLGAQEHRDARSPWFDYLREMTVPFRGPISALARYLNEHGKPGQTVWITDGDLPLRFHTPLSVYGGLSGVNFGGLAKPDWVVLRSRLIAGRIGWDRMTALRVVKTLDINDYRRIELEAPDIPWESRPEPDEHFYTPPEGFPPVLLYQKR